MKATITSVHPQAILGVLPDLLSFVFCGAVHGVPGRIARESRVGMISSGRTTRVMVGASVAREGFDSEHDMNTANKAFHHYAPQAARG